MDAGGFCGGGVQLSVFVIDRTVLYLVVSVSPQYCSLTGLAALWKKPNRKLLLCKHSAASYSSFSALLLALVEIIPQNRGDGS